MEVTLRPQLEMPLQPQLELPLRPQFVADLQLLVWPTLCPLLLELAASVYLAVAVFLYGAATC